MYTEKLQVKRFMPKTGIILLAGAVLQLSQPVFSAATKLADQPPYAAAKVPPNLLLALSVEFPTGMLAAYTDIADATTGYRCGGLSSSNGICYVDSAGDSREYSGYFDPRKCYAYDGDPTSAINLLLPGAPGYFYPTSLVNGLNVSGGVTGTNYSDLTITTLHRCDGTKWSGNFLNWATMHALDIFRATLTGGDRVVDTAASSVSPLTLPAINIIEKTRHSGQGSAANFPYKRITNSATTSTGTPPGAASSVTFTVPAVNPTTVVPSTLLSGSSTLFMRSRAAGGGELAPPFVPTNNSGANITGASAKPDSDITAATAARGRVFQISTDSGFANNRRTFMVRVKVCDPTNPTTLPMEKNCSLFNNSYKPTGLIQDNIDNIRVGAMGYLNTNANTRAGGVLRARVRDLGRNTIVPNGTGVANPYAEITADGQFITNPAAADATASGVTNSGVMNYLNKFGKANGYQTFDVLSEMYYEGLRYLHLDAPRSPTSQYLATYIANSRPASEKDGFPVIEDWASDDALGSTDPLKWYCQKNFIVGIADSNTHCDTSVPGAAMSACSHPVIPPASDPAIAAALPGAFTKINTYEASGVNYATYSEGRNNTQNVVGLSYWAHVNDIRPAFPGKPTGSKITVDTFWVDVMEGGVSTNGPLNRIQMWMSAKYGGFKDVNNNGQPANSGTWDANADGLPDNYFRANRPDLMSAGLRSIFDTVKGAAQSAAGAALSSPQISSVAGENAAYISQYDPNGWYSSQLNGYTLTDTATGGDPTLSQAWNAKDVLGTQVSGTGWNVARFIVTSSRNSATQSSIIGGGIPFRRDSLTSWQQSQLSASSTEQTNVVNYLRGDRSMEIGQPIPAVQTYRTRKAILGSIIDSEVVQVGKPRASYTDTYNPGYSTFKAANANRKPAIYVGASDGMLHVFDGDVATNTTTGGKELWAYIPSLLFTGPTGTPGPHLPNVNSLLGWLANPNYQHRYMVNLTPNVTDVDFTRTASDADLKLPASPGAANWKTLLVGGLAKGGAMYFAIDATTPPTVGGSTEASLASKVLWEFSDADMGYSYGRPMIVKTKAYGWVVLLTSGYNNTSGPNPGKGFLYVVNAKTGKLLEKIGTGVGDATTPSGLGRGRVFIPAYGDYIAEMVYIGDLLGNIWRFDLSIDPTAGGTPGSYYSAPTKFATLTASDGTAQPIVQAPTVEIDNNGVDRYVVVGTGRLLDSTDLKDAQKQSIYVFRDGTLSAPYSVTSLPPTGAFPITRSGLTQFTDLLVGGIIASGKSGWYYDLPNTSGTPDFATERASSDIQGNAGLVAIATTTPTNPSANVCSPGGAGSIYAFPFATGKSVITDPATGLTISKYTSSSAVLKPQFVKVGGVIKLYYTESATSSIKSVSGNYNTTALPTRVYWREIVK